MQQWRELLKGTQINNTECKAVIFREGVSCGLGIKPRPLRIIQEIIRGTGLFAVSKQYKLKDKRKLSIEYKTRFPHPMKSNYTKIHGKNFAGQKI